MNEYLFNCRAETSFFPPAFPFYTLSGPKKTNLRKKNVGRFALARIFFF
jgi:hypothetical protein